MNFQMSYITNSSLDVIASFKQKEFSIFTLLHDTISTTPSTSYGSLPLNVAKNNKVTVLAETTNNGTFTVLYSYDGSKFFAKPVTGALDSESGKYVYEWSTTEPIVVIKYKFTEGTNSGVLYGGVSTVERVVL